MQDIKQNLDLLTSTEELKTTGGNANPKPGTGTKVIHEDIVIL